MAWPRPQTPAALSLGLVAALTLGLACHKQAPPSPAAAAPLARQQPGTLFDHGVLAGLPARPRPDCSPPALMAAARHVGELERLASGVVGSRHRGKASGAVCPTAEGQLVLDELRGALPERVSSCMSQDAPFDAEWDMVNSAVIALQACVDCARPHDERAARCRWVAEQAQRAEAAVKSRTGLNP